MAIFRKIEEGNIFKNMIKARNLEKSSPLGKPLMFSSKKHIDISALLIFTRTWITSDVYYQRGRLTSNESAIIRSD